MLGMSRWRELVTGRGSRKRSSSARNEKMERAGDIEKNGRILFDRPKPTVGCSANGRRSIVKDIVWGIPSMPCFTVRIITGYITGKRIYTSCSPFNMASYEGNSVIITGSSSV